MNGETKDLCDILLRSGWLAGYAETEDGGFFPHWTHRGGNMAWFWRLIWIGCDLGEDENLWRLWRVLHGREAAPAEWLPKDWSTLSQVMKGELLEIFDRTDPAIFKEFCEFCVRWAPTGENGI